MTDAKKIKLTKRMKQLLQFLAEGLSNGEIAEKLFLSEHTVKVHMWRMYQRIGVTNRGGAAAFWIKTNGNTETIEQAFERGRQAGRKEMIEGLAALQADSPLNGVVIDGKVSTTSTPATK